MTELFAVKRELVLTVQDPGAASDDPLEVFLLRRGWNVRRVQELQGSISEKNTLDMFTGQTRALDAAEVEFQADVDLFFGGVQ